MNFTPDKITEARGRAGMAAMVDIDTFLSALDDIEYLTAELSSKTGELQQAREENKKLRGLEDGDYYRCVGCAEIYPDPPASIAPITACHTAGFCRECTKDGEDR
jgi:hypothetical protein